jgi:DNA-binding transcriptional regulator GbsR (MarR family)
VVSEISLISDITEIREIMKITPVIEKYILHWGEMGTRWGVNRTVSQIHALLYLSPEPLRADEITVLLTVARSNVSTSLKELQSWGLVKTVHTLGDRRDYFEAKGDTWEMLMLIVEERKKREIDPTLTMLRQCVQELESDKKTPVAVQRRIENMLGFISTLDTWFDQVKRLPRPTLIVLMKMGAKVAKLIPSKG